MIKIIIFSPHFPYTYNPLEVEPHLSNKVSELAQQYSAFERIFWTVTEHKHEPISQSDHGANRS